jgi:DnaK suppressor protein
MAKKQSTKKQSIKKQVTKKLRTKKKNIKVAKKPTTKKPTTKKTTTKKTTKIPFRVKKIHEIKKKLISQKAALLAGAEEALNELPGQTAFPDLGDQATAEIDRNFMLRLRGRERKLLKKIDDAIERIDQGVFGICDKCGEEIDIRRLEARPVTNMCIECKTQQEEEEKLREK